jgi:hypothetical protein
MRALNRHVERRLKLKERNALGKVQVGARPVMDVVAIAQLIK